MKPLQQIAYPPIETEHNYAKNLNVMIDQQYADDISWATNNTERKTKLRKEAPNVLEKKNLQANDSKTEEHLVKRGGDDNWKKCKYLGSLLDTEADINRRKILAIDAYTKLKHIFENKKVSLPVKIRIFRSHVESIFMYNCELWIITKNTERIIDVLQRNILRKILNIRWPQKISNIALYDKTKTTEWSKTVKRRRLQWYGHLLRLPENNPAKKALREAQKPAQKPRGGQKHTWLKQINKELEHIENYELIAKDRHMWRLEVNRVMSS